MVLGMGNKREIGGRFAEMKADAPRKIEPAQAGLQSGTVHSRDLFAKGTHRDSRLILDDDTVQRRHSQICDRGGRIDGE